MGGKWRQPRTLGEAAVGPDPKKLAWFYENIASSELKKAQSQLENAQSVKFNRCQLQYLVSHLQQAVNIVREMDFCSDSDDKVLECLGGLKLLAQLAIRVRNFTGECSKEEWIKAATIYVNASVHVAYLRYYLKACTALLCDKSDVTVRQLLSKMSISVDKLEEENSRRDQDDLSKELGAIRDEGTMSLVGKLIGRLKTIRGGLDPSLAEELGFWEVESNKINRIPRRGYLGSGSFGVVFACKCLGFDVAEKFFEIPLSSKVQNSKEVHIFEKEVKNMVRLSHPNVVQILFYAKVERGCSLVVEMMDGNLTTLVNNRTRDEQLGSVPFSIDEAVDIMLQIAEGMYYIHGKNVVHRDLKPDNVLFKYFGIDLHLTVKVTDFGECKWVDPNSTQSIRQIPVGSLRYRAPEARNRSEANGKSDVYSYAMVCYMILTGKEPEISLGEEVLLNQCPDVLKDLMKSWWHPEPDRRPCFGKICEELRIVKFSLSRDSSNVLGQANHQHLGNFSQWLMGVLIGAESSKSQVQINRRQCDYLFEKLKSAVQHALIHLLWANSDRSPKGLGIMKFLSRLAKDIEIFIQDCCKREWIVSAIFVSNTSELVASIGYNLELCTQLCISGLDEIDITTVKRDEIIDIVRRDQSDLMERLSMSSMSNSEGYQSAENSEMLQKRLETMLASSSETSNKDAWRVERLNQPKGIRLGREAFCDVYAERWLGTQVAVKYMILWQTATEVSFHISLDHPKIVRFYGWTRDGDEASIISELMDSDLRTLMDERLRVYEFPFTITESIDIALQVSEAMEYMHQHHIVHRDLQSSNILVKIKKIPEVEIEVVEAKVCDFGSSKRNYNSETYSEQTYEVGTIRWMAPENFTTISKASNDSSKKRTIFYPFKRDVYTFGVLCSDILTGKAPFKGYSFRQVREMVVAGQRPQLPDQCPRQLRALIERCWDGNPRARPSFDEISRELRQLKCFYLREPVERHSKWHDTEEDIMQFDTNLKEFKSELQKIQCERGFSDLCIPYSDPSASGQYLGSGRSRTIVYKTTVRGVAVAQKDFIMPREEQFKDEVRIIARLGMSHPNIIRLKWYAMSTRFSSIVTELMDCDLGVLIRRRSTGSVTDFLPSTIAIDIMHQIAQGMHHVHKKHVVHRDLKAENILIRVMNGSLSAKVADFGESIHLGNRALEREEFSNVGTFRWMAPEVMSLEEYDRDLGMEPDMPMPTAVEFNAYKTDVYSFGMVCYEILVGQIPYFEISKESLYKEEVAKEVKKQAKAKCLSKEELSELKKNVQRRTHLFDDVREVIKQVKAGRRPSLPENCPDSLRALIIECWDRMPKNRPPFAQIVKRLSNIQRRESGVV